MNFFITSLNILNEKYLNILVSALTFKYFTAELGEVVKLRKLNQKRFYSTHRQLKADVLESLDRDINHSGENWNIETKFITPLDNSYRSWGNIVSETSNELVLRNTKDNSFYKIEFDRVKSIVDVSIIAGDSTDINKCKLVLKFRDHIEDAATNTFNREFLDKDIIKNIYSFKNGKLVCKAELVDTDFIKPIAKPKPRPKPQTKEFRKTIRYITIDLETLKNENNILEPISISIYDGRRVWSYNILKFNNWKEMLIEAVKSVLKPEYNNWLVYFHNFSKFDGVFLLNILVTISNKVEPLVRDSDLLNITLTTDTGLRISFRDSLLLIPGKLKDLCKNFRVSNQKDFFPFKLLRIDNLHYECIGAPPKEEFEEISDMDYRIYQTRFRRRKWKLIKELIKYNELDSISLHQVIKVFRELIISKFKIDACYSITLSSLAINNYRTNFLDYSNCKLPIILGLDFLEMKKAYKGGAVDIYKPYGEDIKRVDVNSLYPFVIIDNEFPVGVTYKFIGDYREIKYFSDKLGVVEADIETPVKLRHPVLITTNDKGINYRPLGKWTDWYATPELINAAKFGYKYKVKKGISIR